MIAFKGLLVTPAVDAGISVPEDPENYDASKFPHWHVYTVLQVGASMPNPRAHFENAKIVASVPHDQIEKVSYSDLKRLGWQEGSSYL